MHSSTQGNKWQGNHLCTATASHAFGSFLRSYEEQCLPLGKCFCIATNSLLVSGWAIQGVWLGVALFCSGDIYIEQHGVLLLCAFEACTIHLSVSGCITPDEKITDSKYENSVTLSICLSPTWIYIIYVPLCWSPLLSLVYMLTDKQKSWPATSMYLWRAQHLLCWWWASYGALFINHS